MKKAKRRTIVYKPRMSHHKHSFKPRPHGETSYALLTFLCLLGALILMIVTSASLASPGDPVTGEISFTTAIMTAPPNIGAVIASPVQNQRFSTARVEVTGSCMAKRLVKIYKNNVYGSSGLCNLAGRFNIVVSLFNGQNILRANNFDAADQPGPESPTVTVFYDSPNTGTAVAPLYVPLQLLGPTNLRAYYVGDTVPWPLQITGGKQPYAISIDWGDGESTLVSRTALGSFDVSHTYKNAGKGTDNSYVVTVTATDSAGNETQATFVVIVRDKFAALKTEKLTGGSLMIAWPALIVLALLILVFWLGEKFTERFMAGRQSNAMAPRK